jgi:signal transduction histidine kinase
VAQRWRIRHKLLLGLGLVLGAFALMLTGTVQSLTSYMETMKVLDNKLAEKDEAEAFQEAVKYLFDLPPTFNIDDEEVQLRQRMANAQGRLDAYEKRLQDSIDRRRDPDLGEVEKGHLNEIHAAFAQMEKVITKTKSTPIIISDGESKPLVKEPQIISAKEILTIKAGDIRHAINEDLFRRIAASKSQYTRSMAIVIVTAALGVIIMAGLLRFFYGWIFQPLHRLQEGVRRVASGNFEGRIDLQSGDELEELAEAFNDMTRRLHASYRDLTDQVNERGKQLVRSERLASVGFLAAGVAHEINNPLASIAFCSEALERRLGELLARLPREQEAVGKYLKMIQQEAFRCKAITQNLLEFSRVGEGERVTTDLSEVVQSVLEMVQHLKVSEGKRAVFRPTGRLVAEVNPQEIKQVVLNLVVNAMESMDEGGTLTITLAQSADGAELIFADSGCGMPADILENIFEPFFTRSRTGKGTGLGLSISQRIVTQHGGEIEATSPGAGQGSTFVVRLPLNPAAIAKEDAVVRLAA